MGRSTAIRWGSELGRDQSILTKPYDRRPLVSIEISFLGTFGTLSVIILFYILAKLSEKLGSVQKMEPYYRYYFAAIFFLAIGFIIQLLMVRISATPENFPTWLTASWFLMLAYYFPLALGVTIGLIVTWHYWSWLVINPRD